jgi:hypothetical protein
MSDVELPLSPAGRTRREQILALALATSRRRRRSRMALRGALASVSVAIAILAAFHSEHRSPAPPIAIHTMPTTPSSPVAAGPEFIQVRGSRSIVVARIKTDHHISTRIAARTDAISIDRISDDQLLDELASADQPAGIARMGGKSILLRRH